MKVVWARGAATVREVCATLSANKPTAYTTVLTLMGILEDKGVLSHVRSGRAYTYRPMLSRQQATQNQVNDTLSRFFNGSSEKLLEYLLSSDAQNRNQVA